MANPSAYVVSYSFAGFQASSPTTPLPAPALDNELANVAAAVASLVSAIESVRRSDGMLQNGIVTFDSLASGLQLTFDPTNGNLVAAAVAGAQASATAASGSATTAAGSAATATTQAAAAAASASSVNLSLYLAKANNLAGLGSNDMALANIGAAKVDGSTMTGRLAPHVISNSVADFNTVTSNGWSVGGSAANSPPGFASWIVETISLDGVYTQQKAYPYGAAGGGITSAVQAFRRYSYDSGGGVIAWTPWESNGNVPVGSLVWLTGTTATAGLIKANGTLLSRASYPALYAFAAASGNIVSDASWLAGNSGAYSTGDLATTFRIPDARGEFIRGFDNGRAVDSGRAIGSNQADSLKDHTHLYTNVKGGVVGSSGSSGGVWTADNNSATSSPSTGAAAETRPRNIALLACIKF